MDDGGDGEVGATKGGNVNTFASQLMINKNSRIKKNNVISRTNQTNLQMLSGSRKARIITFQSCPIFFLKIFLELNCYCISAYL